MKIFKNILLIPFKLLIFPIVLFLICFYILASTLNWVARIPLGIINIMMVIGLIHAFVNSEPTTIAILFLLFTLTIIGIIIELIPEIFISLSVKLSSIIMFWF